MTSIVFLLISQRKAITGRANYLKGNFYSKAIMDGLLSKGREYKPCRIGKRHTKFMQVRNSNHTIHSKDRFQSYSQNVPKILGTK
jgi:hypothetical protein